jgi:hypothetical protein
LRHNHLPDADIAPISSAAMGLTRCACCSITGRPGPFCKQEGGGRAAIPPATGDEHDTGHGRRLSYRGKQLVSRPDHQPIGQRVLQRPLETAGLPVRRPDA